MRLDMLLYATTNDLIPELSFGILFSIFYFMPHQHNPTAFIKQCFKSAGSYQRVLKNVAYVRIVSNVIMATDILQRNKTI